jgi:serine protease Do
MGAVFMHPVDQPVVLKVLRGERTLILEIRAPEATRPADRLGELASPDKGLVRRLGIVGVDLNDKLREIIPGLGKGLGVVVGARIQDATSAESGLQAGDIIRTLNKTGIDSLEALRQAVRGLKSGDAVALQIEREGKLAYLSFEME